MESRSKSVDQIIYKSDLEFALVDQKQLSSHLPAFTAAFEMTAPAIAQAVCHALSSAAVSISIKYFRNQSMQMLGGKFNIELRSDKGLANYTNESLSKIISDSISLIDKEKLFSFNPSYSIRFEDSVAVDPGVLFTWKVSQRLYKYNALDKLDEEKIEFLGEGEHKFVSKSHVKRFNYDVVSNPVSIAYEYKPYVIPSEDHLTKLEALVSEHVSKNKKCHPVLKSVISRDYNQALRRACFGGDIELVVILLKHDEGGNYLNLDLNQASSNGKTPLDYANASGNEELISLLSINGAKTKDELLFSLVDNDRKEVIDVNKRNQSRSRGFGDDSFGEQLGFSGYSRHSMFGGGRSHDPFFDTVDMVERINRENRERQEMERKERKRQQKEWQERDYQERLRLNREGVERREREWQELTRDSRDDRLRHMMPGIRQPGFSGLPSSTFGYHSPAHDPSSAYGMGRQHQRRNDEDISGFDPFSFGPTKGNGSNKF